MRLHLLLQNGRIFQSFLRRYTQQFVIRNAAPQKKRESRSQFEIAQPVWRIRGYICRVWFERNKNCGLVRICANPRRIPPSNDLCLLRPLSNAVINCVGLRWRQRPPVRAPRNRR